jgi:hypothetical protein
VGGTQRRSRASLNGISEEEAWSGLGVRDVSGLHTPGGMGSEERGLHIGGKASVQQAGLWQAKIHWGEWEGVLGPAMVS